MVRLVACLALQLVDGACPNNFLRWPNHMTVSRTINGHSYKMEGVAITLSIAVEGNTFFI